MNVDMQSRQKVSIIVIVVVFLIGAAVIAFDWQEVRRVIGTANWSLVIVALMFTVISYFSFGSAYIATNRLFQINVDRWKLFEVGYISISVDNILALLGAAGLSIRIVLLRPYGVKTSRIIAASIYQSYFNALVLLVLLLAGLVYLGVSSSVKGGASTGALLSAGIMGLFLILATVGIFIRKVRSPIFGALNQITKFVAHRDIMVALTTFSNSLSFGRRAARNRPLLILTILGLIVGYWGFMLVVVWFCFYAFGQTMRPDILITGFTIGITAGNLSMVPGGFGVQEASMAGIYALTGIPLTTAILSVILFRVCYDIIPYIVSWSLYRNILRQPTQSSQR
jgi:uncharacterized protein (TIRG00374 family)